MREPTTLFCAALHDTMSPHFDMDSIFRVMIDDTINTRAYVNGHISKDPRQQRSIVFVLKYHTLIGRGRTPLMWQNHDDDLVQTKTHVPISSCSMVVALSLAGKPARFVRSHSRKSKKRDQVSTLYDPFNPWHVLSLQCFPDWTPRRTSMKRNTTMSMDPMRALLHCSMNIAMPRSASKSCPNALSIWPLRQRKSCSTRS